ncbi:hypothetical protein [Sphingobium sp. WCS2017Hpa-17]|uniref:hypothetical protein n=1 Tax=Sphingobium sp. WCS2017Hpa-17 TaxID=3073638 RepID=UPI0028899220|nr:hypothetical protein [Sphingobium sp. WCS2017Hpa-17]
MSVSLFITFLKRRLRENPSDVKPEKAHPDEVLKLLWPLLTPYQGKKGERIRALRYDPASEAEVDGAFEKWAQSSAPRPTAMAPLAQRVFLERLRQAIIAIEANAAAGETLLIPPRSLSPHDRHVAAALLWLHEMELPYPVEIASVH